MNILIILYDPPYGTERSYNGLHLATAICKEEDRVVTVLLLADAMGCAKHGQKVPQDFYNIELMLKAVLRKGEVLVCDTCLDARGFTDGDLLIDGVQRSTMQVLAERTLNADRVPTFNKS